MAALGDDAVETPTTPDEPVASPQAFRVRGWSGRGPVGLTYTGAPNSVRERLARDTAGWLLWWAITGGELDGRPRTNATFWRYGTKAYAWSDRLPSRWHALPRWQRALIRLAAVLLCGLAGWGWLVAPALTATLLWLLSASGLGVAGWAGADSALTWRHRRQWVWPTHRAVHGMLGYPERTPPRRYLYVPPGFAQSGHQLEVALPPDFVSDGADELAKQLAARLRAKLCLNQVQFTWHVDGPNHFLIGRTVHAKPVPRIVPAMNAVIRELIEAQPEAAPLIGIGAGGASVSINLDHESPHALLSVGSGGGKSALLRGMVSQFLRNGAEGTILDFKYTSHDWARGLPSVRIARSIEAIHLALVGLGKEGERRNQVAEMAAAAGRPKPVFRRHLLLAEEINTTLLFLQMWWKTYRHTLAEEHPDDWGRYGDPGWAKSPAVVALLQLMSMGRERRMHVLMVAQHATSNALGGPEIREQFAARILGRAGAKAWGMLAPDIAHTPVCSWNPGRMYLVREGRVFEFQAVFWTDDEARAWATSGEGAVLGVSAVLGSSEQGSPGGHVPTPPADTRTLVTLAEAHQAGVFTTSLAAVKRASSRDPEFPAPVVKAQRRGEANKYDLAELRLWDGNRPSKKAEVLV